LLPYTGNADEDEALHNLINAWYYTGYYAGVYQMIKQQQQQQAQAQAQQQPIEAAKQANDDLPQDASELV